MAKRSARLQNPGALIGQLQAKYKAKNREREFADERELYQEALPQLFAVLDKQYDVVKLENIGSTASVWKIRDRALEQDRALKLARPRTGRLKDIVRIVTAESKTLGQLNHQNVIRVYAAGELQFRAGSDDYVLPYYVMEYIDGVEDLGDWIKSQGDSVQGEQIIQMFRDVLIGLSYLHSKSIVHCDVKPGNILITPSGQVLVADLGYSHKRRMTAETDEMTEVVYTRRYAHPELQRQVVDRADEDANRSTIEAQDLKEIFDLFAFGRTMQEVLKDIRRAEETKATSALSDYQWQYLTLVAKRLLDAQIIEHSDDDLLSDAIPGLPPEVHRELAYVKADDAVVDLEKLNHLFDLEGEVPELNGAINTYIQVPGARVPMTDRVKAIINHPAFVRLGRVSQLGFVSLVYPGASHTRFEHALGTFANCADYIRALWYDQSNCVFRAVMRRQDLEVALVSALLHDIAQYPMAHELTETASEFAHEAMTDALLTLSRDDRPSLWSLVRSQWRINPDEVLEVLHASRHSSFRAKVLSSIVNGPLDCDKLDYVRRDSTHLGVTFGDAIDYGRLTRNLTVVYVSKKEPTLDSAGKEIWKDRLDVAEIGVTEKALVVAQGVWRARKDLFTQVYWQHTVRALKAMLGYLVRDVLSRVSGDVRKDEAFWLAFREFVLRCAWSGKPQRDSRWNFTYLAGSDHEAICFLGDHASKPGRQMAGRLLRRDFYHRVAVLSHARGGNLYDAVYERFRASRLAGDHPRIEAERKRAEKEVLGAIRVRHSKPPDWLVEAESVEPLLLIDVPVKSTRPVEKDDALWYLPEDVAGVHLRRVTMFPRFARAEAVVGQSRFDKEVGKIRVLVHPDWREQLVRALPEDELIRILAG